MTSRRSYAQGTEVPVGRSRDEIERILARFGATGHIWARDDEERRVTIAFKRQQRAYKFIIKLPDLQGFRYTPKMEWERTPKQMADMCDAETRRRFRSLANYIKALMDAIDTGILTAEEALLPYQVLPSGETVYQRAQAQLDRGLEVNLAIALQSPQGE